MIHNQASVELVTGSDRQTQILCQSYREIWVATECSRHELSISLECLVQVPRQITVTVGKGPILLPNRMKPLFKKVAEYFGSNCSKNFVFFFFFTRVKYAILMDDCSALTSGEHGY
jgi:hypothetical protein